MKKGFRGGLPIKPLLEFFLPVVLAGNVKNPYLDPCKYQYSEEMLDVLIAVSGMKHWRLLVEVNDVRLEQFEYRDHSFSTYAQFSRKLTFLTP